MNINEAVAAFEADTDSILNEAANASNATEAVNILYKHIANKINEKEAQSVANNSQTNNTNKLLQTLQLLKNNLWQKTNTQVNSQTNTKQPQEWTTIQKINWKLYKIHIRWNEWQDQHWGKYKVWKDENWKIHLTPLA